MNKKLVPKFTKEKTAGNRSKELAAKKRPVIAKAPCSMCWSDSD